MARGFEKNFFLLIAGAWLALAAVFAEVFIIEQHDHEHTGGDCPVCLSMEIARRFLEALGRAGAAFAASAVIFAGRRQAAPAPLRRVFSRTPVSLKVKSNT